MANEIPQIQDSEPVLNPTAIKSGAEGYEAFAKTLAQLATSGESKVEEMATEQSQTMYINSVSNLEQLKTSAQIRMLENPGQANKIAEQTADMAQEVQTNTPVNSKDRARLKAYTSGTVDDLDLKAAQTDLRQRQNETALTHYSNFYDTAEAMKKAAASDPEKFEQLKNAYVGSLRGLVSFGALTPEQAGSELKTIHDIVDSAQAYHEGVQSESMSAKDFHTMTSSPFSEQPASPTAPVNASTGWLTDYANRDKTLQGVMASLSQGRRPNPEAFMSLNENQREQAKLTWEGTAMAQGQINSGEPFPAMEKRYDELNQKNSVLSYREKGERDRLGNYINQLKNGNYLKVMAQTPIGNGILEDFNSRMNAIDSSSMEPSQKAEWAMNAKDKMVNEAVAYGEGHHIPSQYIQPIPQSDISQVQNSFGFNQNPATAVNILKGYSKQNQMYVANAMKDPKQRVVLQTIALGGNNVTDQEGIDFVAANQDGRNYKEIDLRTNDQISDDYLKNQINTNITGAISVISAQHNANDATVLNGQLVQAGVNYAKFLSEKKGQFSMEKDRTIFGSTNNIGDVVRFINKSYQPMSNQNYVVNKNQVNLTKPEMDMVAQHAINKGNEYIRKLVSPENYAAIQDRAPLTVSVTPLNIVQAKDANGNVYFSEPLTDNLLSHAHVENAKAKAEKMKEENEAFKPINRKKVLLGTDEAEQRLQKGEVNANQK